MRKIPKKLCHLGEKTVFIRVIGFQGCTKLFSRIITIETNNETNNNQGAVTAVHAMVGYLFLAGKHSMKNSIDYN